VRKFFSLAFSVFLFATTTASAGVLPTNVTLSVAIATVPAADLHGSAGAASSAGAGGSATLPSGSISGVFQTALTPTLLTVLDGFGIGAPGLPILASFATQVLPGSNNPLAFDGTTGTMALNASAYLLMGGQVAAEIPLGVVGVGGTQMFHVLSIVVGTIFANPYQLGMVTQMGTLNGAPHTLVGTGSDDRTAGGQGTLVLVSPTFVNIGAVGNLASIATLTMTYAPEPGTALLLGAGVAALAALGRKRMA